MTGENESSVTSSYVEIPSAEAFAPTIACLVQTIEKHGMTIFARIDHAAGARDVGMAMPPAVVLIYGNPRGGTPVMLAAPHAALDLPLRVLVREDLDGRVLIGYHPAASMFENAGVADELVMRLEAAQTAIVQGLRA